jgi:hypothetical protein
MSKFTSAMNAAKERTTIGVDLAAEAPSDPAVLVLPALVPPVAARPVARRGRPPGKRSSAESIQVTAYIREETHYRVKMALLMNSRKGGSKQVFSDLVQDLLAGWLDTQ